MTRGLGQRVVATPTSKAPTPFFSCWEGPPHTNTHTFITLAALLVVKGANKVSM
jgi:hypothetical protein